ncbi:MAG: class I SAM-dependent RNA methyltransferase, partial [Bacteroidota bacterium]
MYRLVAKTYAGFEQIVADELAALGASDVQTGFRAVTFRGDLEVIYKANLYSRFSLRILRHIITFPAPNEQQLYDGISRVDWSELISADDTLAVDAAVTRSNLTHSQYVAQKTKDAIVDQFRRVAGRRPNVDLENPTLRVNVYIHENTVSVSVDSSGSSLHKRGYRVHQGVAPLSEVLAAGMLQLAGWDKKTRLIDPFCGSGTLLIEAALMAANIAPGIFRKKFGFMFWRDFDKDLWSGLVEQARAAESLVSIPEIVGLDISHKTIGFAKENVLEAGFSGKIGLICTSFMDYRPVTDAPWFIISNPPYGERITSDDLNSLYREIGNAFKRYYPGSVAWLLSGSREAEKAVGLRPA